MAKPPKPPTTEELILAQVQRIADAMEALLTVLEGMGGSSPATIQQVRDRFKRLRYTVEPPG